MLITNSTICTKCKKEINWYRQIYQRVPPTTVLDADIIPRNKQKIIECIHIENQTYELQCYCPHCYHLNTFNYESDIKL